MFLSLKSTRASQSANDEVYRLIEVYPDQVEMPGCHTARVTVHNGQTIVVIYLTSDEVMDLGDFRRNKLEALPEWFRSRVSIAVISSALKER